LVGIFRWGIGLSQGLCLNLTTEKPGFLFMLLARFEPLTAVSMIEGNNMLKPRNQFKQFSFIPHQVKKQIEEERNRLEKEIEIQK
jgi:hypothetical protein